MTSSVKGNIFGRITYPPSITVIALIRVSELCRGADILPGTRRPKKPGLDSETLWLIVMLFTCPVLDGHILVSFFNHGFPMSFLSFIEKIARCSLRASFQGNLQDFGRNLPVLKSKFMLFASTART